MADFANLTKLLGGSDKESTSDSSPSDEMGTPDDMGSEDSGAQVFTAAAQEAFHALKDGDIKTFTEALKTAITGTM